LPPSGCISFQSRSWISQGETGRAEGELLSPPLDESTACATPLIKPAATASAISLPVSLPEPFARVGEDEAPEGDACADGGAWEP
jgi:hypothetical protein